MTDIVALLWTMVLLVLILAWVVGIGKRWKERFPTEKERDYE
jgi:hypothetical protein